jgi:hypothetical protein
MQANAGDQDWGSALGWGPICPGDMARVTRVQVLIKLLHGGETRCDVVASYPADDPSTGRRYPVTETVFTTAQPWIAQRAADMFRRACALLSQQAESPRPEPPTPNSPERARQRIA